MNQETKGCIPGSAPDLLCDPEEVTSPLCLPFPSQLLSVLSISIITSSGYALYCYAALHNRASVSVGSSTVIQTIIIY